MNKLRFEHSDYHTRMATVHADGEIYKIRVRKGVGHEETIQLILIGADGIPQMVGKAVKCVNRTETNKKCAEIARGLLK